MKKKIILAIILTLGFFFGLNYMNNKIDASTVNAKAGITDTSGANLNVRSSNSVTSGIVAKIKDNTYLTIISSKGNWYYVEYNDSKYGYVHKDYVDIVSSNTKRVNTNGSNLNVRYGPSTSYFAFDKIGDNDYVVVLSQSGNWTRILFEGNKIGYVSSSYLSSTSQTYPKINLDVVSYKQFDSRWASKYIGNSGKTFKQIGCLTTAMAMSESYRRGTTITPLYYESISSYTADGSLYWSSRYSFSTSSSYLTNLYNILKQGKPAIIGFKNSKGSQHWVVVYGYKGSNSLSASNFLIHDPGSSYRDTLDDLIATHPTFYKTAYYSY